MNTTPAKTITFACAAPLLWAALRFGPRAELIHPDGERLVSARDLLVELGALLELDVGAVAELDQAADQLELGRRAGLRALEEGLVALTYDGF